MCTLWLKCFLIVLAAKVHSEFVCRNGIVVNSSKFCDNVNDCGDYSDEGYGCTNTVCGIGTFACLNSNVCKPISGRCDGIKDCIDGSDEKYCEHEPRISENCSLEYGKYFCEYSGKCISLEKVCDGVEDCPDGADEGDRCFGYGKCDAKCTHPCISTPQGPTCLCHVGDNLKDKPYCDSIKVRTSDKCDQKCITFGSNVSYCACAEDYKRTTNGSCVNLASNETIVLYSTGNAIKSVIVDRKSEHKILENLQNVSSVAASKSHIYWVEYYDGIHQSIVRAYLNGTETTPLIADKLKNITDLDVDWITGNIYFADIESGYVGVCAINPLICTILHDTKIDKPKAIALAPKYGLIFWGTTGSNAHVGKSDMNGENLNNKFVTSRIKSVRSITVDELSERVFWLDDEFQTVSFIHFDGSGRSVAFWNPKYQILSVSSFENRLFWITEGSHFIGRNFSPSYFVDSEKKVIRDIYAYNPIIRKHRAGNPCSKHLCGSGLCLLAPRLSDKLLSFSCKCKADDTVHRDGFWCYERSQYLTTTTSGTTANTGTGTVDGSTAAQSVDPANVTDTAADAVQDTKIENKNLTVPVLLIVILVGFFVLFMYQRCSARDYRTDYWMSCWLNKVPFNRC